MYHQIKWYYIIFDHAVKKADLSPEEWDCIEKCFNQANNDQKQCQRDCYIDGEYKLDDIKSNVPLLEITQII